MSSKIDGVPLAASHPNYPVMGRDELLAHVEKICQAIEACGASPELTVAVTLASDLVFHLRRYFAAPVIERPLAPCEPAIYGDGQSVCLVDIPKEAAEDICRNISAATGWKVDWHYIGGRVHIKALAPPELAELQATIERLRAELGECKGEYDRAVNKVDALREQLAGRDALLRDICGKHKRGTLTIVDVNAALSASAEPSTVGDEVRDARDYAVEHAGYLADAADQVLADYQAYSLAQMLENEGGDDGDGEHEEAVDSARDELHEGLANLRSMTYEFRKRRSQANKECAQ